MTAFNYSSGARVTNVLGHTVYAKASWAGSWVAQPNLTCVECSWTAAPNFNSALLQWETGYVILPGDTAPTTIGTWIGRGQFIKVEWACDDGGTLVWVGFIDSSSWPTEAFGRQQLVCYGLDRALALTPIISSVWKDGTTARRNPYPLAFNRVDETQNGLRSDAAFASGVYAFHPLNLAIDSTNKGKPWSTRDIVRYLLAYSAPTNTYEVASIPWSVDQLTQLPDWDAPVIETLGRTLWDVLTELISPDKQLGFTVGSNGTTAFLRCFTHFASALTVGGKSIDANPNQHSVVFAPDALTEAELSDVGSTYDQVLVRGARRKSICTLSYEDGHLQDAWTTDEEDEYEDGAIFADDYASWDEDEKREQSQRVRDALPGVFRDLRIAHDWDFTISTEPVFPDLASGERPRNLRLLAELPIDQLDTWDGDVEDVTFSQFGQPGNAVPLATFEIPVTGTALGDGRISLMSVPLLASKTLSALSSRHSYDLVLSVFGRTVRLAVDGAPQHVIAPAFAGNPEDFETTGGLDYETLDLTVCIEEDRYCQAVYPASTSGDVTRRLVVYAGEAYQQVYIVQNTVTALDFDGTRKYSNGGYLIDDSGLLAAFAQAIAGSMLASRKRATWRSQRRISGIAVGDLITTAAGASVVAPVTEIKITAPTAVGRPAPAPVQSFATWSGVFDPLAVLRRVGFSIGT
jgi:hypothetical protein